MRHRLVLFSLLITWVSYNALAQLNPLSENAHARMVFQRALTAENREDWEILIGLGIESGGYGVSDKIPPRSIEIHIGDFRVMISERANLSSLESVLRIVREAAG